MDAQTFQQFWDHFRQKYGIYLRLLDALPADRFHSEVVPGMRPVAQLVAHTSGSIVRGIATGVRQGRIDAEEAGEEEVAAGLPTKDDVLRFARECWDEAAAAAAGIGDAQLQAMVPTPWDMTIPGVFGIDILNDEFTHHRGQLYVYARVCGVEPPFMWSFAENDPDFAPRG